MSNNTMLNVRVPKALKNKLKAIASFNEVPVSRLIRHQLNSLIDAK
jgi:antitoxin component of RelBE/YafQ-DinJ toxin-antitoxin module